MLGESEYKLLFKSVMSLVLCCLLEKGSSINVNVSPACVNNFLFQEIHNKGEKKNQAQSDLIHLCDYNLLCAHNFRGETQTPDSGYNTHCLFVSGSLT